MPAVIVETGAGLTNANSYVAIADVDTYTADHGADALWDAASEAEQQEAVIEATQYIDAVYNARWLGLRTNRTQRLAWPRAGIVDPDGYDVDSDDLPRALEEATIEAALRHFSETDGLLADVAKPGGVKRERVKVGPIEEEIEYTGGRSDYPRFAIIDRMLVHLVTSSRTVSRG